MSSARLEEILRQPMYPVFLDNVKILLDRKEIKDLISTGKISPDDCKSYYHFLHYKYDNVKSSVGGESPLPYRGSHYYNTRSSLMEGKCKDDEMAQVLSEVLQHRQSTDDFEDIVWAVIDAEFTSPTIFLVSILATIAIVVADIIGTFLLVRMVNKLFAIAPSTTMISSMFFIIFFLCLAVNVVTPILVRSAKLLESFDAPYRTITCTEPPILWLGIIFAATALGTLLYHLFIEIPLNLFKSVIAPKNKFHFFTLLFQDLRYIARVFGCCFRRKGLLLPMVRSLLIVATREMINVIYVQRIVALWLLVTPKQVKSPSRYEESDAQVELRYLYRTWRWYIRGISPIQVQSGEIKQQSGQEVVSDEDDTQPQIDEVLVTLDFFMSNRPSHYHKVPQIKILKSTLVNVVKRNPDLLKENDELTDIISTRREYWSKSNGTYKCGMCQKVHNLLDCCPFVSVTLRLIRVVLPFLPQDQRIYYGEAVRLYEEIEILEDEKKMRLYEKLRNE